MYSFVLSSSDNRIFVIRIGIRPTITENVRRIISHYLCKHSVVSILFPTGLMMYVCHDERVEWLAECWCHRKTNIVFIVVMNKVCHWSVTMLPRLSLIPNVLRVLVVLPSDIVTSDTRDFIFFSSGGSLFHHISLPYKLLWICQFFFSVDYWVFYILWSLLFFYFLLSSILLIIAWVIHSFLGAVSILPMWLCRIFNTVSFTFPQLSSLASKKWGDL